MNNDVLAKNKYDLMRSCPTFLSPVLKLSFFKDCNIIMGKHDINVFSSWYYRATVSCDHIRTGTYIIRSLPWRGHYFELFVNFSTLLEITWSKHRGIRSKNTAANLGPKQLDVKQRSWSIHRKTHKRLALYCCVSVWVCVCVCMCECVCVMNQQFFFSSRPHMDTCMQIVAVI